MSTKSAKPKLTDDEKKARRKEQFRISSAKNRAKRKDDSGAQIAAAKYLAQWRAKQSEETRIVDEIKKAAESGVSLHCLERQFLIDGEKQVIGEIALFSSPDSYCVSRFYLEERYAHDEAFTYKHLLEENGAFTVELARADALSRAKSCFQRWIKSSNGHLTPSRKWEKYVATAEEFSRKLYASPPESVAHIPRLLGMLIALEVSRIERKQTASLTIKARDARNLALRVGDRLLPDGKKTTPQSWVKTLISDISSMGSLRHGGYQAIISVSTLKSRLGIIKRALEQAANYQSKFPQTLTEIQSVFASDSKEKLAIISRVINRNAARSRENKLPLLSTGTAVGFRLTRSHKYIHLDEIDSVLTEVFNKYGVPSVNALLLALTTNLRPSEARRLSPDLVTGTMKLDYSALGFHTKNIESHVETRFEDPLLSLVGYLIIVASETNFNLFTKIFQPNRKGRSNSGLRSLDEMQNIYERRFRVSAATLLLLSKNSHIYMPATDEIIKQKLGHGRRSIVTDSVYTRYWPADIHPNVLSDEIFGLPNKPDFLKINGFEMLVPKYELAVDAWLLDLFVKYNLMGLPSAIQLQRFQSWVPWVEKNHAINKARMEKNESQDRQGKAILIGPRRITENALTLLPPTKPSLNSDDGS